MVKTGIMMTIVMMVMMMTMTMKVSFAGTSQQLRLKMTSGN